MLLAINHKQQKIWHAHNDSCGLAAILSWRKVWFFQNFDSVSTLMQVPALQELELLEQRGQGIKTKMETQAKYGW